MGGEEVSKMRDKDFWSSVLALCLVTVLGCAALWAPKPYQVSKADIHVLFMQLDRLETRVERLELYSVREETRADWEAGEGDGK